MTTEKPLRADAARNRLRVLETAETAFAEEGVGVSFDEIARRAGVGVGTVYRHFPTKDALFGALMTDRLNQLTTDAEAAADAPDPDAAFYGFFGRMIERALLNLALCDAIEGDAGISPATVWGHESRFRPAFGRLLARAQDAGAVRTDVDIADLRAVMIGCLAMERQAPAGRQAGSLAAIACAGLRPKNS
ncbi:TetR/AcrR family transcriptional regulator [Solihabitans fulvus]|uniref:TetR/AcrR family transcriptional regulator n=1 Tax=Solihabitans fulvus TaxID=1892852 RepID=A0A5B2X693_9PSEU|nr:TetR/AcrR family transcriptional regulator [Solihabitans fulvus]KAA2258740.1 TetR/AcrR family transcriptional regulator [Solihabitans fulvus]